MFVSVMLPNTLLKWQLLGYSFRGELNFLFQSEFGMCATSNSYGKEPLHIIFEAIECIILVHFELVLCLPYNTKTRKGSW